MINNDRVEFCINAEAYKQILNNNLIKAPLRENVVEVAVYMLLYGILDNTNYCVVDSSPFTQEQAWIYLKEEAKNNKPIADKVPDLVIVGKEFKYDIGKYCVGVNESGAYCFVEVKSLEKEIKDEEVEVQIDNTDHYIWTNGLKWVYRCKDEKNTDEKTTVIANLGKYENECTITYESGYAKEFEKLLGELSNIFNGKSDVRSV